MFHVFTCTNVLYGDDFVGWQELKQRREEGGMKQATPPRSSISSSISSSIGMSAPPSPQEVEKVVHAVDNTRDPVKQDSSLLGQVQGHLVVFPLQFLVDEALGFGSLEAEGFLPDMVFS